MDRLFRKRGLNIARIGPLERLTYIGSNAMGAMSYRPVSPDVTSVQEDIPVSQLAAEVQEVLKGEGGEFLWVAHHRERAQNLCCIATLLRMSLQRYLHRNLSHG